MRSNLENIKAFLIETLQRKNRINLFANYFSRMEENFAKQGLLHEFENFIHSYLTIYSSGEVLYTEDIYPYFRDFYQYTARIKSDENILKHIYRYSNYYLKIFTKDISDIDAKNLITKINKLEARDTYSYLIEVFEDYEFAHINKNMFVDILETVLEYAANRKFSNKKALPFAMLSAELNKMLAMKNYIPQTEFPDEKKSQQKPKTINDLMNLH